MIPAELFELPGAYSPEGTAPSRAEQRAGIEFKKKAAEPSQTKADRPKFRAAFFATVVAAISLGVTDIVSVFPEARGETQSASDTRAGKAADQVTGGRQVVAETAEAEPPIAEDVSEDSSEEVATVFDEAEMSTTNLVDDNQNFSQRIEDLYAAMRARRPLERPADINESAKRTAEARNKALSRDELSAWSKKIADDLSKYKD